MQTTLIKPNTTITNEQTQAQPQIQEQEQRHIEDKFHSNELLAKIVINKIINLSLREAYVKDIENQTNDYYHNFIKNDINNCLTLTFINIDSEDIDPLPIINNNTTIHNAESNTSSINTWIEINEPTSSYKDTSASSLIKSMHVKDPLYSPIKIYQDEDDNRKNQEAYDKKFSVFYNPNTNNAQPKTHQEKERDKFGVDITPTHLINELIPTDENEEIIELRIQKQLELIRISNEIKKQKEMEEKEKVTLLIKEKIKPFDSFKFTFDSEGNVIPKKTIKNDYLSKEFYLVKHDIRDVHIKNDYNSSRNKKAMAKTQTENVTHNPNANGQFFNTAIKTNNPFAIKDNDKMAKLIVAGSNFDIILPEIGVRITEEKKIKGGEKEFSKRYKKTSKADYEKMLNESIPKLNSSFMKSKLMNTMSPSNNLTMINQMNLNMNSAASVMDSTTNYVPALTEGNISMSSYLNQSKVINTNNSNNPLLNSSNKYNNCNIPIQEFTMIDRSINNNNLTMSFNLSKNSRLFSEEDKIMKLNKKLKAPLKMTMDSIIDLKLIDDSDRKKPVITDGNIFKSQTLKMGQMIRDGIEKEKDENILYCKNIIKTKDWGRTSMSNPRGINDINKTMTFSKPSQGSVIRELGVQIVNTKEPRSRKYKHVLKKIE